MITKNSTSRTWKNKNVINKKITLKKLTGRSEKAIPVNQWKKNSKWVGEWTK